MRRPVVALACVLALSFSSTACKKKETASAPAPAPSAKDPLLPPEMANAFLDADGGAPGDMFALGDPRAAVPPEPPKTELKSQGSEPRTALLYNFATGKPQTVSVTLRTQVKQQAEGMPAPVEGGGPPVRLTLTVTPTEKVAGTDKTKFTLGVQKAELVAQKGGPAMPKELSSQFELVSKALTQVQGEFLVSKQGSVSDFGIQADPLSQRVAGDLLPLLQEASELLFIQTPEEAVGLGAQWQVKSSGAEGPQAGTMTATYTLKERSPQGATIGIETSRTAPAQPVADPRAPKGTTMELAQKGAYTVNVRFASVAAKSSGESETTITTKDPSTQPPRTSVATVKASQLLEAK